MSYSCEICQCNVPCANWEEHLDGWRHRENAALNSHSSGQYYLGGGVYGNVPYQTDYTACDEEEEGGCDVCGGQEDRCDYCGYERKNSNDNSFDNRNDNGGNYTDCYDDGGGYDDDDDYEYSEDDSVDNEINPWEIQYSQNSIAAEFTDGTTFRQAIHNILHLGFRYPVRVYNHPDLGMIAINNRTLYCYLEARVDTVPVIFVNQIRRRAFGSVFIRGSGC